MTDTERILEIIKDKGLSNVQFCTQAGISPATLSHITSGRSNPTLSIFKQVVIGFPDLNPEWVYQGTGNMYKDLQIPIGTSVETSAEESSANATFNNRVQDEPVFNFPKSDTGASSSMDLFGQKESMVGGGVIPRGGSATQSRSMQPSSKTAIVTGAQLAEVVKETMAHYERPHRKIIEVRVFFDDGTYESFGSTR